MAGDLLPYFKVFPAETLADERFASWTVEERGAWFSLLLHAWVNGSIPSDEASIARLLHVDATALRPLWVAIGDRFSAMDHLPEGRLSSPRLEDEREEAIAKVRAGKKGAKSRWTKKNLPDATALRPQCDRNADPMPITQLNAAQINAAQGTRSSMMGVGHPAYEAVSHWTHAAWPKTSTAPCPEPTSAQARDLAELCAKNTTPVVCAAMDRMAADTFWAKQFDLALFLKHFSRFLHDAVAEKPKGRVYKPLPPDAIIPETFR